MLLEQRIFAQIAAPWAIKKKFFYINIHQTNFFHQELTRELAEIKSRTNSDTKKISGTNSPTSTQLRN